ARCRVTARPLQSYCTPVAELLHARCSVTARLFAASLHTCLQRDCNLCAARTAPAFGPTDVSDGGNRRRLSGSVR
ncbi:hypothetical protein, partial [uncultured Bacteroides sp.]|uniref:hypothetical protein n=1 Tax=uncultured Bacteroides sp. TaxID=162156 RepID=UPI00259946B4